MSHVPPEEYYWSLPRHIAGAGAILHDQGQRVLLVKPSYRETWQLPGGAMEAGEFPWETACREVREEIGLELAPGRLLAVDWVPLKPDGRPALANLARDLAADVRLPWQQPCCPGRLTPARLTPARVGRGYRSIRQKLPVPASAPKPSRPGPSRPAGSKNQRPATRHNVGKTVKRTEPKTKNQQADSLNNKLRARADR